MGRRGYPAEFRRKVLDLVAAGRPVARIAAERGISDQTIYTWARQDRIDQGLEPGLSTGEKTELAEAKRRIHQLQSELAATRRAMELIREVAPPKVRYAAVTTMATGGNRIQLVVAAPTG
jgi:transposase-like protein